MDHGLWIMDHNIGHAYDLCSTSCGKHLTQQIGWKIKFNAAAVYLKFFLFEFQEKLYGK